LKPSSSEHHVYANDKIISFLYDRPDCKPKGGRGDHRCDVILVEIGENTEDKYLWAIECKSKVERHEAEKAIKQIEGCLNIIDNAKGWKIEKCVIGSSFSAEATLLLKDKGIIHTEVSLSNQCKRIKNIVVAAKKIKTC
jgi:hypothetical protein